MELLTNEDLHAVIDILGDIRKARTREDIIKLALQRVARLLGSDATGYNEVNLATGTTSSYLDPDYLDADLINQVVDRFSSVHPLIVNYRATGDMSARQISDFISQREFHDSGLYQELFKKLSIEYHMALPLPSRGGVIKAMVFNRHFAAFTERDRAILNILGPHFTGAFESLQHVQRLQSKMKMCRGMLQNISEGIVVLRGFSKVESWTDKARFWLGKYFPGPARRVLALPDEITAWLRCQDAAAPGLAARNAVLVKQRGAERLHIRLVCSPELGRMLLLAESTTVTSAVSLESLGLSPRQAEVLLHVAYGRSNGDIARILGISEHTVRRHLEAILKTINAPNRTAACRIACSCLASSIGPMS
jgi:DNA-binding CsgD family transcriptional regulator